MVDMSGHFDRIFDGFHVKKPPRREVVGRSANGLPEDVAEKWWFGKNQILTKKIQLFKL